MIQLNLLPDIKLTYIKAQRSRRMLLGLSILIAGVAIGLLVLLFSFGLLQKKHLSELSDDITADTKSLQKKPSIERVLTVQNQLDRLTELHQQKPEAARLLTYLNQLTPVQASISTLNVSFVDSTLKITGSGDALSSVNRYIDTLKFTKYVSADDKETATLAFSDVVLESFSLNGENKEASAKPASYSILMTFDPLIYDNTQKIKLVVPNSVSTRSELQNASELFQSTPGMQGAN